MRDPEIQDRFERPFRIDGENASARNGKRPNIWRSLSRLAEVVIYVLLILVVYKLFGPELDRQEELKAELKQLNRIESEKQAKVVRLRQEHRLLKTDKEYLETVARDRLNLQREGEFIMRIEREED
ncbi:MAG: septum formation initiator family protein [Verrucomicrobiales bacterium]